MKLIKLTILAFLTTSSLFAQANPRNQDTATTREMMRKIEQLEQRDRDLSRRVRALELAVFGEDNNRQIKDEVACSVSNSASRKMYLGKASTQLEAEMLAKEECRTKDTYQFSCGTPTCEKVKSDSEKSCIVVNSASRATYLGKGSTVVEATVNAMTKCTDSDTYKFSCSLERCSE